jgi:hypothetical protein
LRLAALLRFGPVRQPVCVLPFLAILVVDAAIGAERDDQFFNA